MVYLCVCLRQVELSPISCQTFSKQLKNIFRWRESEERELHFFHHRESWPEMLSFNPLWIQNTILRRYKIRSQIQLIAWEIYFYIYVLWNIFWCVFSSVCNNCCWKSPRQAWLIRAALLLWFRLCGSCSDVETSKKHHILNIHKCSGVGTSPRPESRAWGVSQES